MDIIGLLNRAQKPHNHAETKKGEEADAGFEKLFQDLTRVNHAEQRASARTGAQEVGSKAGVKLGKGSTDGTDLTALQQAPAGDDATADAAPADGATGLVSRPVETGPALVDPDAPAAAAASLVARGAQEGQNTGGADRLPPGGGRTAPPAAGNAAPNQFLRQPVETAPTGQRTDQSDKPRNGLGAKVEQTPAQLVSRPGAAPGTAQARLAGQAPTAPTSLLGTTPPTPIGVGADAAASTAAAGTLPGSAPAVGNQLAMVNAGLTGGAAQQQAAAQAAAARLAQAPTVPQPTAPQPTAPGPVDAGTATAAGPSQQASQTRAAAQSHTPQAARHAPASQPVAEQVAVQIQRAVKAGIDRINIQLKPAQLGRIDISLDVAMDGRVQAVIQADNPDTLQMLMRDHRELERALQQANLQLDQNSLSFELRGENKRYAADGSLLASGDGGEGEGEEIDDGVDGGIIADSGGDGVNLVI